jgi:hypothetical protein
VHYDVCNNSILISLFNLKSVSNRDSKLFITKVSNDDSSAEHWIRVQVHGPESLQENIVSLLICDIEDQKAWSTEVCYHISQYSVRSNCLENYFPLHPIKSIVIFILKITHISCHLLTIMFQQH